MEKKNLPQCRAGQVNTEFWAVNPIQHAEWLIENHGGIKENILNTHSKVIANAIHCSKIVALKANYSH